MRSIGTKNPQKQGRTGVRPQPRHKYGEAISAFFRKSRRFSPCDWGWFLHHLVNRPNVLKDAVEVLAYLQLKGILPASRRSTR